MSIDEIFDIVSEQKPNVTIHFIYEPKEGTYIIIAPDTKKADIYSPCSYILKAGVNKVKLFNPIEYMDFWAEWTDKSNLIYSAIENV